MEEPVRAADGFAYEREEISAWLQRSNVSPMTNLELEHTELEDDVEMRGAIAEWRAAAA